MNRSVIHYEGDLIKKLELKKNFSQRPLWKTLESLKPQEMVLWVDKMDSLCPVACEWALVQAFETAARVEVSQRDQIVRSIYCELNRFIYLTTYISQILKPLGVAGLFEQGMILREQVFRMQEEFTGGRVLPQVLCIGGVRRDLALGDIQKLQKFIQEWSQHWQNWKQLIIDDPMLEQRLGGLIKISQRITKENAYWGIIGKASQIPYDSRVHQPHGAYALVDFKINYDFNLKNDAYTRFMVACSEVDLSINLCVQLLGLLRESKPRKINYEVQLNEGFYSGVAESARGPVNSFVEVDANGSVRSVKLFNTSQRMWPHIEDFFVGARYEDFDLGWASLGISAEESEV